MLATTELQDSELDALKHFVASEGWRAFAEMVEREWGAAKTLQRIEAALASVPRGDQAGVNDTVQQIQTARNEILKLVAWPMDRIGALEPKPVSRRPFDALRRIRH